MTETTVINVSVKHLRPMGYSTLVEWLSDPKHVYVGRRMVYVPGAEQSKWHNPFSVKKFGREGCIAKYKERLLNGKDDKGNKNTLLQELPELEGKVLGCWCHPNDCHAHVLAELCNGAKHTTTKQPQTKQVAPTPTPPKQANQLKRTKDRKTSTPKKRQKTKTSL
eukprot:TRINITY_DN87674_c0_g1_i1.p1 TRINITY_DN87674_c0_g1~~TRINITY_DN87674_c0_g1_i1.p1  ORF type:complete len:165 (-),score=8.70 TRINITY_DN87674_c0_g1_i1:18-512(-)